MKKRTWVSIGIIIFIIILSTMIIKTRGNGTPQETVMCIGKNAELYIQLGCNACKHQEEMFGENYEYLTVIDCWYEREKCGNIEYTPTWIINGEKYIGVQQIEKLKELTGC
jgi:hypothetical protein